MLQGDDGIDVSVSLNEALERVEDGDVVAFDRGTGEHAEALILCRVNGIAQVYENVCPHAGRRLDWAPGQFLLDQGRLVCAAHGASFELDSGLCVAGPCKGASLRRRPPR